jgi:hypothetical protein
MTSLLLGKCTCELGHTFRPTHYFIEKILSKEKIIIKIIYKILVIRPCYGTINPMTIGCTKIILLLT